MSNHKPSAIFMPPPTLIVFLILIVVSWPGAAGEGGNDVVPWVNLKAAFGLSSSDNNEGNKTTPLVLAADRSRRKDPTDGLDYYTGGWNISNRHYIASVIFTGFPVFAIGAVWLVCFGVFLLVACMCCCCCCRGRDRGRGRGRGRGYSKLSYACSLILLLLFTIAAIIGSIFLYMGQDKFHGSTRNTLNFIVSQANSTAYNLRDISAYLTNSKTVVVDQEFLPQQVQTSIDKVNTVISSAADKLGTATNSNKDKIFRILDFVRLNLIIVASVILGLAFFGFLLSILGLQCLVYVLVVVGWILVAITFIICGIFLVLHNVMGDTCVAMNDWVVNPTAHTALDDIIPCVEKGMAEQALSSSKLVTYGIVLLVDTFISNVSNANLPPDLPLDLSHQFRDLVYNQSGPLMPLLCNPYNPDLTKRSCAPGELDLSNATKVWQNYVCKVSNHKCTTEGRLTPEKYDQINAAMTVAYGLHHYGPFLTNLVYCTFLRDTFSSIHKEHCPGLKLYSKWVYVGLAMVSAAVMLSLILWVLYARERRQRKYIKIDASSARSSFESKRP